MTTVENPVSCVQTKTEIKSTRDAVLAFLQCHPNTVYSSRQIADGIKEHFGVERSVSAVWRATNSPLVVLNFAYAVQTATYEGRLVQHQWGPKAGYAWVQKVADKKAADGVSEPGFAA